MQTGLGDRLFVAQYNLSGDVGSVSRVAGGNTPLNVTGIDKSAYERLAGKLTGEIAFNAFFNDAAGAAHPALSPLPSTDVIVSYLRGTTLGGSAASMVAKQINYDGNRGADGSLIFGVQALSNGFGIEWGQQLTAGLQVSTGAEALSSIDTEAQADFGLQAYLHVTAFTGTSATITIQESQHPTGSGDAFTNVTGGAFTTVTGVTSQRIFTASNLTVERYLRLNITGTYNPMSFVVTVKKNLTATTF